MERSLLSRDESNAIKGVLIFLIILGHNLFFTSFEIARDYDLMRWLYSFHIQSFFLLPFLYGKTKISCLRVLDYFIRFIIPFLIFLFILVSLKLIFFTVDDFSFYEITYGCITGSAFIIKKYTSVQYLWFLPVFFYLMVLKGWYDSCSPKLRVAFYILSGLISIFFYSDPMKLNFFNDSFTYALPFILCHYLFSGLTLNYLLNINLKAVLYFIFFIGLSIAYMAIYCLYEKTGGYKWYEHSIYNNFIKLVMPYVFMGMLMSIKSWLCKFHVLTSFGRMSFGIYLFSPLFGYLFYFIINRFLLLNTSFLLMILVQGMICFLSYYVSIYIHSNYYLSKLFFPHGIESLKLLFARNRA